MTGVNQLYPTGTNSTMFTECCDVAICNDERCCPLCNKIVIGADAESDYKRWRVRWKYATSNWKR